MFSQKRKNKAFEDNPSKEYLRINVGPYIKKQNSEENETKPINKLNIRSISTKSTNIHSSINNSAIFPRREEKVI
jgi:hypothetical protein